MMWLSRLQLPFKITGLKTCTSLQQSVHFFSPYCTVCYKGYFFFYIHGSVHRNSILIRSNKMQQYAVIYVLQNHSTCFGCPSHPSSGVHKTVTAASGTGHITYLRNNFPPTWPTLEEGCRSDTMTCTRGCSYSFMDSWWWVRWTPETCRVVLQ